MAEEGLKWLLEFDAKLGDLNKAVDRLAALEQRLGGVDQKTQQVSKGLGTLGARLKASGMPAMTGSVRQFRMAFDDLEQPVKKSGGLIGDFARRTMSHFTALAAWDGIKRIGQMARGYAEELLYTAGAAQRTEKSFELLLGAGEATKLLDYIDQVTEHTEFTDDAIKRTTHDLLKVGYTADKIPRALAAATDIAAFSGSGEAGLAQATNTLEMIKRTGVVNNRILGGMGIAQKDLWAQLAKDTGMGLTQVRKALGKGKIETDQILESLYSTIAGKTKKHLGGAGVDMSKLFLARLTKVKDLPSQFFQGLSKSKGLSDLSDSLGKALGALNPKSPLGKKMMGGLDQMLTTFAGVIGKIDFEKWAGRAVKMMELLGVGVQLGAQLMKELGEVFDMLTGFGEALGETLFESIDGLGNFFNDLIAEWADMPATLMREGKNLAIALWTGFKDGIVGGITSAGDAVGNLAFDAVQKMKGLLGIRSPSSVFEGFGEMTALGYVRGIEGSRMKVDRAMERTFEVDPTSILSVRAQAEMARTGQVQLGAGTGGPVSLSVPITVNVQGGANVSAEDLAARIRDIVPGQLQAAFDQLRTEMGIA